VVVAGEFTTLGGQACTNIGILNSEGGFHDAFGAGADAAVLALAVQDDGKILAGGRFMTLGGETRDLLGRLTTAAIAGGFLSTDTEGTAVYWQRDGAAPDVGQVVFEQSMDGLSFSPVGGGARVLGGWGLVGQNFPQGRPFWIRASGRAICGMGAGSIGMVTSVAEFYLVPEPPLLQISAPQNGILALVGQGSPGLGYTLQVSTNLTHWQDYTNLVAGTNGLIEFPDACVHPMRLYRLRWP
jgi:hypothetical protein